MIIPWSKILGVGFLLYAGYLIYKGEIDMTNRRRYKAPVMIYKRSEQPLIFWGLVGLIVLVALFVLSL